MTRKTLPFALAYAVALPLAACGDDGGGGGDGTGTSGGMDDGSGATSPTSGSPTTAMPTTNGMTTMDPDTTMGPDTTTGNPGGDVDFRFATLAIEDPHFFALIDVTGMVNALLSDGLNTDSPDDPTMQDGFLDLGFAVRFMPLDQADGASESVEMANAQCTAPVETTTCGMLPMSTPYPTTYTSQAAGVCQEADPTNVTAGNMTSVTMGPCFVTGSVDLVIQTASFNLPLGMATVAASYVGDPADQLVMGTLHGFLTNEDAAATILADTIPVVGGMPLDALLRDQDRDEGGTGWWLHVAFTAELVDYS